MTEPLHVTNGDCAGGVLRRSTLPGAVLSWQDSLHEGPLAQVEPAELNELRARFLASGGWGSVESVRRELDRRDAALREAVADRHHIVLWFEHDLFDQLQLVQILALLAEWDLDLGAVQLVVVGEVAGRPDFKGLGELEPEEIEPLWPLRQPLTRELLGLGEAIWAALCAPDPRELASFLDRDTSALPFLAAALRRFLEELPDTEASLSRTERQILEEVGSGAGTPAEVFTANAAREQAPYLGDGWLWQRIHELGGGERPLLTTPAGPVPVPPPRGDEAFTALRLELTDAGSAVLAGELDRVDALGIDRWLGGTHLVPGSVWRWDRGRARLVAPR